MTKKYRIAIIEDHPVMRQSLAVWFSGTGRWQVTGAASSLVEARELLNGISVDVLLLDIQLEDGWGLDIIPWYKQEMPDTKLPKIAVYSAFNNYAYVSTALGMGVQAYICKNRSEEELEKALLKALNGEIYIDDTTRARLKTVKDLFDILTKRECEILSRVKSGLSNKQIASELDISVRTVENILYCVYDKTGIKTRRELEGI